MQEGFEILVRAFRTATGTPIIERPVGPRAHIAVAGAGVVDAHLVVRQAAQELIDRLFGNPAPQIPKRDVDGRAPAGLGAGAGEADIGCEVAGDAFNLQRIAADEGRRRGFMDIGLGGARAEECLAQSDHAGIGVNPHPEEVGEFIEADGFDARDFHDLAESIQ